jgi:hypothetical protein
MQRRSDAGDGSGDCAAASGSASPTAAQTVTTLLQLKREASKASQLFRTGRRHELLERALAAAQAAPALRKASTLIVASLVDEMADARVGDAVFRKQMHASEAELAATLTAGRHVLHIYATESESLKQQCLDLLHARWRAGKLFVPTADERTFFAAWRMPTELIGAELYISIAAAVVQTIIPPRRTAAEQEARLRCVYGALCVALELDARGCFGHRGRARGNTTWAQLPGDCVIVHDLGGDGLITNALRADPDGGPLHGLRAVCGLSGAEEAALRALAAHIESIRDADDNETDSLALLGSLPQYRVDDVARHGLRTCALPECGKTECEPKAFKLCSRCRRVCYCSSAHQHQDWRRHKHDAGGCKAADDA